MTPSVFVPQLNKLFNKNFWIISFQGVSMLCALGKLFEQNFEEPLELLKKTPWRGSGTLLSFIHMKGYSVP